MNKTGLFLQVFALVYMSCSNAYSDVFPGFLDWRHKNDGVFTDVSDEPIWQSTLAIALIVLLIVFLCISVYKKVKARFLKKDKF